MRSTTRRARGSIASGSLNSARVAATKPSSRASAPGGLVDLGEEGVERLGAAGQRAQDVEGHDVARALPDRAQRRLAVQARHPRRLDVAVAAQALQCLESVAGGALADVVLGHRGGQALEGVGARIGGGLVVGAREAQGDAVAASDSMARSASTLTMSGWSARRLPNALRCAACHVAWATAARIPAAVPMTQSRRVWLTISMIVGTPRPGSPTRRARAPRSSISLEALERLPSLSFRRCSWKPVLR